MYKLSINGDCFDKEISRKISDFFYSDNFKELTENLNLDSLEEIIITDNFSRDLNVIREKYDLSYAGFTDNNHGKVAGKVLHTKFEKDNFKRYSY